MFTCGYLAAAVYTFIRYTQGCNVQFFFNFMIFAALCGAVDLYCDMLTHISVRQFVHPCLGQ